MQLKEDTQSSVDQKYFKIHFIKLDFLDFKLEAMFKRMMKESMGYTNLEVEESFHSWRTPNSTKIEVSSNTSYNDECSEHESDTLNFSDSEKSAEGNALIYEHIKQVEYGYDLLDLTSWTDEKNRAKQLQECSMPVEILKVWREENAFVPCTKISPTLYKSVKTLKIGYKSNTRNFFRIVVMKELEVVKSYLTNFKNLEHLELFNISFSYAIQILADEKLKTLKSIKLNRLRQEPYKFNGKPGEVTLKWNAFKVKLNKVTYLVEADEIKLLNKFYGKQIEKWVSRAKDELVLKNVDLLSLVGNVRISWATKKRDDVPNVNLSIRGSTVICKVPIASLDKIHFPKVKAEYETLAYISQTWGKAAVLQINWETDLEKECLANYIDFFDVSALSIELRPQNHLSFHEEIIFQKLESYETLQDLSVGVWTPIQYKEIIERIKNISLCGKFSVNIHKGYKHLFFFGMPSLVSKETLNQNFRPDLM